VEEKTGGGVLSLGHMILPSVEMSLMPQGKESIPKPTVSPPPLCHRLRGRGGKEEESTVCPWVSYSETLDKTVNERPLTPLSSIPFLKPVNSFKKERTGS
jgi:hypothetical protein